MLHRHTRRRRRGATAVEVAVIMPVFILFVLAIVEIGHAIMLNNMVKAAARNAARFGSTEGVTSEQVADKLRFFMKSSMDTSHIDIVVKDASIFDSDATLPATPEEFENLPPVEVFDLESRQLYAVRASIQYDDVAFLRLPYFNNIVLTGQAFMRHE